MEQSKKGVKASSRLIRLDLYGQLLLIHFFTSTCLHRYSAPTDTCTAAPGIPPMLKISDFGLLPPWLGLLTGFGRATLAHGGPRAIV